MTVKDLKQQLQNLSDDMQIRLMNSCIIDDEYCPSFDITGYTYVKNSKKEKCLLLEFSDDLYIAEEFKI
jgi:hypothetical protein